MSEELLNNPELEENNEGKVEETQVVAETTPEVETPEVMAETPTVTEELPLVETTPVPRKTKTIENAYPSLDDFSWDSIEKKGSKYTSHDQEMYEELYTKTFKSIDENEVISGSIVSINAREIVVNIGFKSDGVISANELRYNPDIKIGDTIEVYVENQEDATGQTSTFSQKSTYPSILESCESCT